MGWNAIDQETFDVAEGMHHGQRLLDLQEQPLAPGSIQFDRSRLAPRADLGLLQQSPLASQKVVSPRFLEVSVLHSQHC